MPRMRHAVAFIASYSLLLIAAGCSNHVGDDRAQLAEGKLGLMPAATPGFEQIYVANQGEVKLVAERKLSYESLDTFRDQNLAAAKKAAEKKTVAQSDEGGNKKAVAKKSNGRIAGIKDNLKQKLGGILGAAGVDTSTDKDAKAEDASKDSEKDEADDDSEDEEDSDADDDSDDPEDEGDSKTDDDSKGDDKKDDDAKDDE